MNRPKKQGTAAETRIVELHKAKRLLARRLAEGGRNDLGDVEVWSGWLDSPIIGEVKDRERLNAAEALEKAVAKSGTYRTALFWTQRVPIPIRGTLARKRRCVVIPEALWLELIGGANEER
jgi:hypothetical protein